MKNIFFLFVFACITCSCTRYSQEITESLALAGENRGELVKVLKHYRRNGDTLKYEAASFLIANMKWHYNRMQFEEQDSSLLNLWRKIDYLYTSLVRNRSDDLLQTPSLEQKFFDYGLVTAKLMKMTTVPLPVFQNHLLSDVENVNSKFLIDHIDNAFHMWKTISPAKKLTFEQFLEYILPYRSMADCPYIYSGKQLNDMFSKQLNRFKGKDMEHYVFRYNHYALKMQSLFGRNDSIVGLGLYDIFLSAKITCQEMANYACNILRACGYPVVVDYNMAYKEKSTRHYYCSYIDSLGNWHAFNPQTESGVSLLSPSLNIYRDMFGAQKDSPRMLRNKGERIPREFNSPCIKDVSETRYRVTELELPFPANTSNRLAYLYTFQNSESGLIPVTWGMIDTRKQSVFFKKVLYNVLYFPVYLKEDGIEIFGEPFYITLSNSVTGEFAIKKLIEKIDSNLGNILLTRKYPEKSNMIKGAESMINGRFEGANREDFSDASLLYQIKSRPRLQLQEYDLYNNRAYRYYRYVAPGETDWGTNISILAFLAEKSAGCKYTVPLCKLPVENEQQIERERLDENYVQLAEKDIERMQDRAAFDGRMQTTSFMMIDYLKLEEPVVVQKIRMAPLNAENHIVGGDRYQLMYWENGWKDAGVQKAVFNFLEFKEVPLNRIYWLRNLDHGREELPFLYEGGQQKFIYHSVISQS